MIHWNLWHSAMLRFHDLISWTEPNPHKLEKDPLRTAGLPFPPRAAAACPLDVTPGGVSFIRSYIHPPGSLQELRTITWCHPLSPNKNNLIFSHQIKKNKTNCSTLFMWNSTCCGSNFSSNFPQVGLWKKGLGLSAGPYPDSNSQPGLRAGSVPPHPLGTLRVSLSPRSVCPCS